MKLSSRCIVVFLSLLSSYAIGQVATGTPPFGSFGGGPFDVVNLGNLNVHFAIPVLHKAGRGTPFTYDLSYDSSVWTPVTSNGVTQWQPAANWGWRGITEAATGYLTETTTTNNSNGCITVTYSNYVYHDSFGAPHPFAGVAQFRSSATHTCTTQSIPLTATAADGSGYGLYAVGPPGTVTDRGGRVIVAPLNGTSGAGTFTDANGNQLTVNSSGQFFDTLSGSTPALTVSGSGTSSSPLIYAYTAPSGATAQYQMNFTNYTVGTGFSVSPIKEYGPVTNVPLVSSVQLPDGTSYQFIYETGPTSCSPCVTGRIKEITLPTGGTISYSYTGSNGIESDGSTAGINRTLNPGGEWQYSRTKLTGTPGPGSTWKTIVTDPANNQTVINFAEDSTTNGPTTTATYNLYETQRLVNQLISGSQTLLLTTQQCYNGNYASCATSTVGSPILTLDSYSQPANGSTRGSHVEYNGSFNGSGLVSCDQEYGYGVNMGQSLSSFNALRYTIVNYANLANGIYDKPSFTSVSDCTTGTCSVLASTSYYYDQTTPTATSGTPQLVSITGSRGNLTTLTMATSSSASLTKTFSYYDTGNVYQANDVNGAQTSYTYGDCGNSFPTTINEPLSMSRSMTWNCTGGALTKATDESGNSVTTNYTSDPYFWRPNSIVDQANYTTTLAYSETATESNLTFGSSVSDFRTTVDGFGRPILSQQEQGPSLNEYDTVQTNYNSRGQVSGTTMPFQAAKSTTSSTAPSTSTTYDALGRPTLVTDAGGGTVSYTYTTRDVLVTIGPAPTGEHMKQRQFEYDAIGRLVSVCEVTAGVSPWLGGNCAQSNPLTGYWTTYSYTSNSTGPYLTVTQNAQASSGQQIRTFQYDWLGRLTSESNPESGTTTYAYDTIPSPGICGGYTGTAGDLLKVTKNDGSWTCYLHDLLHRLTDVGNSNQNATNPVRHYRYDSTANARMPVPTGYPATNIVGQLMEATTEAGTTFTDEWFSYGPRGLNDFYESTPDSGGYYHAQTGLSPNMVPGFLNLFNTSNAALFPTETYGLDPEGRVNSVTASSGLSPVPVTPGATYVTANGTGEPVGALTGVTFGSQDSDSFQYDPNTGRMKQYSFNVNGQSQVGNLGWNANGTLNTLGITDPFGQNNQNCTNTYDDMSRISTNTCSPSVWGQTFSYDPFGNITQSGSGSWQPNYVNTQNQYASVTGISVSYDNNGNLLYDTLNHYTWDVYGDLATVNGGTVTNDAFGRMVENTSRGLEIVYSPADGAVLAAMQGQTLAEAFIPLPGGAGAGYNSSGLNTYFHKDWLGSLRMISLPNRTVQPIMAYAPFGEGYGTSTPMDVEFTAGGYSFTVLDNENGSGSLQDFMFRRYSPSQGRWISPDPAGLAAVDPTNPQTWNRYAYVANNPLSFVDPSGLFRAFPGGCQGGQGLCPWEGGGNPQAGGGGGGDCSDAGCGINGADPSSDCPICTGPYGEFGTAGIAAGWINVITNPGSQPTPGGSPQFSERPGDGPRPTLLYPGETLANDDPSPDGLPTVADELWSDFEIAPNYVTISAAGMGGKPKWEWSCVGRGGGWASPILGSCQYVCFPDVNADAWGLLTVRYSTLQNACSNITGKCPFAIFVDGPQPGVNLRTGFTVTSCQQYRP